jgi:hypothetical protein
MTLSARLFARAPFLLVTAPTATFNALALNIGKTSPRSSAAMIEIRQQPRGGCACHSLSEKMDPVSPAQRSASLKGVHARLRGQWASGALQTRDRYAHHLREGPGTAAHRFATLALHRIRDTKPAYLSAYGVKPAGDAREWVSAESMRSGTA